MPLREPFIYEGNQYEELIGAQEGLRAVIFLIQNLIVCTYVVEGDKYSQSAWLWVWKQVVKF